MATKKPIVPETTLSDLWSQFQTGDTLDVNGGATFNDAGADVDFRIEGDTATNLVFVDASLDAFQVGTTVAGALIDARAAAVVFNEPGNDVDFRFEGDADANLLVLDGGTSFVGIGILSPTTKLQIQRAAADETATLGANQLTSSGWTSTGWTGSYPTFTHNTGNTTALTNTLAGVNDQLYKITLTLSGRTAGSFTITFGGRTSDAFSTNGTVEFYQVSNGTGTLSFTPTSTFDGTISNPTVQNVTGATPVFSVMGSNAVTSFELQTKLRATGNMCLGPTAGECLSPSGSNGNSNVLVGNAAGRRIATGTGNMCLGSSAGNHIVSGGNNVAIGANTLLAVTSTFGNLAIGTSSLDVTTGASSIGIGTNAGGTVTTGSNNIFIGDAAGNNSTGTQLVTVSRSIAIGSNVDTTADDQCIIGPTTQTAAIIRGGLTVNDQGLDADTRVQGDTASHMIFVDASAATENIALLATGAPNWQTMDKGLFIGNTDTAPTGNPSSGAFLYVNAGTPTVRNSAGHVAPLVKPPKFEVFTSPTGLTSNGWTKEAGAVTVEVHCIGGGGGGGSGRRGAAASNRGGGGGGGGGAYAYRSFAASSLSATEDIRIGAGGTAGGDITTDSTDGAAGGAGGTTSFGPDAGPYISAGGGGAGGAGTTSGGAGGAAGTAGGSPGGSTTQSGGAGGAGVTSGVAGTGGSVSAPFMAGAGGGGAGGVSSVPTTGFSGSGGTSGGQAGPRGLEQNTTTAGLIGAFPGGNGDNGACIVAGTSLASWGGAGGGGGGAVDSNAPLMYGFGGNSGTFGGGGGAGASKTNGLTSSFNAGQIGRQGVLIIITHFA